MTDPLISEYLPVVNGHIVRHYAWMRDRGNCLITIEDLQQIAAITLINLTAKWDDILAREGKTRDGNGGLFWTFLAHQVKQDVLKYYERVGTRETDRLADSIDADDEFRTSIRIPDGSATGKILTADIAAFYDTLPRKDKVLIALRHFDELPYPQIASILGANKMTTFNLTARVEARWRDFARNQFTDHQVDVARRVEVAWEPPESLIEYVHTRHRKDLSEYLGYVTLCLRNDVTYLTGILGGRSIAPGAMPSGLSPSQQVEVDKLIGEGVNKMEISRRLGVTYGVVIGHAKRRQAA